MPKETGMMFKGPLVRAILEGRKTQTRRLLKTQPPKNFMLGDVAAITNGTQWAISNSGFDKGNKGAWPPDPKPGLHPPYGGLGDLIHVRETHAHHPRFPQIAFRADGEEFEDADGFLWNPIWTPAIHMKKVDARIWLEITRVRMERLHEISEADCISEGIEFFNGDHECGCRNYQDSTGKDWTLSPRESFVTLWQSTGADWDANPWVWVYDFKRIERPTTA